MRLRLGVIGERQLAKFNKATVLGALRSPYVLRKTVSCVAYVSPSSRKMSRPITNSMRVIMKAKPSMWKAITIRSLIGLRKIPSQARNTMCPPSRTGIGRKLITARLALSMVRKTSKFPGPWKAESPAAWAIVNGPPSALNETWRPIFCRNR